MGKRVIKELTVELTYVVELGDVEVDDDVFEALESVDGDEIDAAHVMSAQQNKVAVWIEDNVTLDEPSGYRFSINMEE
ncbi:MAG: hypothetical protein ACRDDZ_06290 [Marinifilaceae bacterium]